MGKKGKMMFKGKQVLLLGLVALVITAGYYRWTTEVEKLEAVPTTGDSMPVNQENTGEEQKNQEKEENSGESNENINKSAEELRRERDKGRDEIIEQWQKIAQSGEAGPDTKQQAEERVKTANLWAEKERAIENMIKSKGFGDCFARIGENGVSVTVYGGDIDGSKVSQIKDIIISETGVDVNSIKISAQ